jgi:hypothetical protein
MKLNPLNNLKYTIYTLAVSTVLLFSLWKINNAYLNIIIFVYFLFFSAKKVGSFFIQENKFWQLFFGLIIVPILFTLFLTPIYWFYKIDKTVISLSIIFFTIFLLCIKKTKSTGELITHIKQINIKENFILRGMVLLFFLCDFTLLGYLVNKNFGDTLASPWTIVSPKFFILTAFASFLLLYILQKTKNIKIKLIILSLHFFVLLSVALIIFKYGFGFDPFIHQASEKFIKENGQITPKQPFYIGQYIIVLLINFFTKIPIEWIDKALTPTLASFTIPTASFYAFKQLKLTKQTLLAIGLLPILPLSFFTQTTPHNLALLFFLITLLWILAENTKHNHKTRLFGFLLSAFTCTIHPLVGIPTFIIYTGSVLYKNNNKLFLFIYSLLLTSAVPLTLIANNLYSLNKIILQFKFNNFVELFSSPYWYIFDNAPWGWRLLYGYKSFLLPTLYIIGFIGLFIAYSKYKNQKAKFFILTIFSLFISAFLISSTFLFENVAVYEQANYAKRFFAMIVLILIPFIIYTFHEFLSKIPKCQLTTFFISLIGAILITVSFYFTYPTRDPISFYTGFTVRDIDIEVVNFIENQNPNTDYIVLTNQTISSASIKEFGFKKYYDTKEGPQFFYSIPTGGPLYAFFSKMVYQEPKKEWMLEAMNFMGVEKAYFVHTSYWAPAGEIRDKAMIEADEWWEFGPLRVWVYEYNK